MYSKLLSYNFFYSSYNYFLLFVIIIIIIIIIIIYYTICYTFMFSLHLKVFNVLSILGIFYSTFYCVFMLYWMCLWISIDVDSLLLHFRETRSSLKLSKCMSLRENRLKFFNRSKQPSQRKF